MGKEKILIITLLMVLPGYSSSCAQTVEEIESGKAAQVVAEFYNGWQQLSRVSDLDSGEAEAIECDINACAEGGEDCLVKAVIDLPREFDHLTEKNNSNLTSMHLGSYIRDFKNFVQHGHATMECSSPHQITSIRGLTHPLPSYFCFTVNKKYAWNDNRNSFVVTDTVWVRSSIRKISGIRNEFGGACMVRVDVDNPNSSYSEPDLYLQAAMYYDQKKYDDAFKIYRKLAYQDYGNIEAQYYLVMMEHQKLGCKWMGDDVRKAEIAWFVEKNSGDLYKSNSESVLFTVNIRLAGVKYNPLKMNLPGTEKSVAFFTTMARSQKPFSKGLMVVKDKKNLYGFADERGQIIIPCQYEMALSFDNSGLASVSRNGLMGYINTQGEMVIPCQYKIVQSGFQGGKAFALKDGKTYLIDTKGNILKTIDQNYSGMLYSVKSQKLAFLVRADGKWDIYDYEGNLRFADCTDCKVNYYNGLISVWSSQHNQTISDYYNW